ncbi:MAG: hypothetical protein HYS13_11345 [Planctomycetia bacterium]|nr:hypothetical protein [Planctomycetia bacterium]
MKRHSVLLFAVSALVVLVLALPAVAQGTPGAAADTLVRLVPDDAGLVVHAEGLADRLEAFKKTPLFSRLKAFPPLRAWRDAQQAELASASAQISQALGATPEELWEHVFGQELVLAVWPPDEEIAAGEKTGPPAPISGPGLLLVRADSAQRLTRLIDAVSRLQAGDERTEWREATHRGVKYRELTVRADGNEESLFLCSVDRVGILTNDDRLMRRVVEAVAPPKAELIDRPATLDGLPAYRACLADLPASATIHVFVSARRWDESLRRDVASASPAERGEKEGFFRFWQSVEYGGLGLEIGDRVLLQGVVRMAPERLPPPLPQVLASFSGETAIVERIPASCLAAVAGRCDLAGLFHAARTMAPPEERRGGAWDLVDRFLKLVGPDFAAYLTADEPPASQATPVEPQPTAKRSLPLRWMVGIGVRRREPGENLPPGKDVLETLVPLSLQMTSLLRDGTPLARLRTIAHGDHRLTLVENWWLLPPGAVAAYVVTTDYLWAGASEATIRAALELRAEDSLAGANRFRGLVDKTLGEPTHLLYADLAAMRRLLAEHKEAFVAAVAEARGIPPDRAERGLAQLASILELADTVVASMHVDERRVSVALGVSAQP